jgi:ribonuclease P protein component
MPSIARAITQFTEREIRALFEAARRVVKTPAFEIRKASTTNPHGRILIVIPRLVGTAPERNRIRRQLKALFYQEKYFEKQQDIIVLVRRGAADATYQDLHDLLQQAFAAK